MKIKGLTVVALICLGLLVWINLFEYKFEELVAGTGAKIEYFAEALSLSYLAAYIFYFLNVYLVSRSERKTILPFIANNVSLIIVNNHSIICCLKNNNKLSRDYFPSSKEYKELLRNVAPKTNVPFYCQNKSWTYLFQNRQKSTREGINRIFMSGKHVDEELRRILLEMEWSLYLREDYAFNSDVFERDNLEEYHGVFSNYFMLIQDLKKYYDNNLKKYNHNELRSRK
jgi:hypothetical protein